MDDKNWQEQLIKIPLCDYEDLLITRLELERLQKERKQEDMYRLNTKTVKALANTYNDWKDCEIK